MKEYIIGGLILLVSIVIFFWGGALRIGGLSIEIYGVIPKTTKAAGTPDKGEG